MSTLIVAIATAKYEYGKDHSGGYSGSMVTPSFLELLSNFGHILQVAPLMRPLTILGKEIKV